MATPLQFAYRTQKEIGLTDAAPVYAPVSGFVKPEGNLRCCVYSPCGRFLAWATNERVCVVDASAGHVLTTLIVSNVFEVAFSPRGTYLSTWERPAKDENGDATKNLKIWCVVDDTADGADKQPMGQFVQKSQTGWNLQYTSDEKFCARLVTNEVQFYSSDDLTTVWNKLRAEGVTDFAVAPGQSYNVAVFIPERKVCDCIFFLRVPIVVVMIAFFYRHINRQTRVNQLQSKFSTSRNSIRPFPRRLSSRAIKCSSSGTAWARV